MSGCYWLASDRPRMLRKRHEETCAEAAWHAPLVWVECAGCQPCDRSHCLVQWHGERGDCETHAESVCPSCLGKAREHLSEIVRLTGVPLVEQVLAAGDVDTEAADLLGPAANPAQWRQRGSHGHHYEPESRMGELHPLWVLGTWDLLVTEHLGHTRTTRITVPRAATYLDTNLHFLAADLEFDFPSLANEVAACRGHLERVLHDGEQRETGAPCMTCRKPLVLVRGKVDAPDHWECLRCRETSTEDQYRFAVMNLHREAADWLTDSDMAIRTGVKAGTVRKWAERGSVRKRRDSGRTVYAVEDTLVAAGLRAEGVSQ